MRITAFAFCSFLVLGPDLAPAGAQYPPAPRLHRGDHAVFAGGGSLLEAPLPRGPLMATSALSADVDALTYTADGRLLAIRQLDPPDTGPVEGELVEIGAGGQLLPIGSFDLEGEQPLDLAATTDGRLFLLTFWYWWNPPETIVRLVELDPTTGTVMSRRTLPGNFSVLAPAPDGLWVIGDPAFGRLPGLFRLEPATGGLVDTGLDVFPFGGLAPLAADTDSTGALWVLTATTVTSPPVLQLWRFDPVTGSRRAAPFPIPLSSGARALAIRRQCQETATARCLQGGRFQVEVSWLDFEGRTGPGRAAPSRSADSALFWFFDPANWELLVKVLDGCGDNGHFWVFAAASTDVAYTLRVTDLETDRSRVVENGLGEAAPAVTDTLAFPCPDVNP